MKGLIEREQLSGLAPAPFRLRKEDAELDAELDRQYSEAKVRETLEDFNRQVIEARRQLLGGPPVVTKTRDVEAELVRWRERRAVRTAQGEHAQGDQEDQDGTAGKPQREGARRPPWWRRRRT
ncbi:hypothetical protein GCM10027403_35030 [Arthrobacter tecti]